MLIAAACLALTLAQPSALPTSAHAATGLSVAEMPPPRSFNWQRPEPGQPNHAAPIAFCFDPDRPPPPQVMRLVEEARAGQSNFTLTQRWPGEMGTPIVLTWSLAPDGVVVDDAFGAAPSSLFARMDQAFGSGGRAQWISRIEQSFERWSRLTGVTFVRIRAGANDWDDGAPWGQTGNAARGDIRIAMKPIDGAGGVTGYAVLPGNGDIVLDVAEDWAFWPAENRFLRTIVMHEIGHALGLDHACPQNATKLMEPVRTLPFDGPQQDDVRGMHELYGDIYEPNNTREQRASLGVLTTERTIGVPEVPTPRPANTATLSIRDWRDQDHFLIRVTRPTVVEMTITPVGSVYASEGLQPDGQCDGGGWTIDGQRTSGMHLSALSETVPDRNLTYWTAHSTDGQPATHPHFLIGPGSGAHIVVEPFVTFAPQLYQLTLRPIPAVFAIDATQGQFGSFIEINWPEVPAVHKFVVRRSLDPGGADLQHVGELGHFRSQTMLRDANVEPGRIYYYFLFGQNVATEYLLAGPVAGWSGNVPNTPPIADAGPDLVVTDDDNDGFADVTLDASRSTDPDGTIVAYRWMQGAQLLGEFTDPLTTARLPLGNHLINLRVTDDRGATAIDQVRITVGDCAADWDGSGAVDGDDLAAFLRDWQAGIADFDGSGGTDGDDLARFLPRWEFGC